MRFYIDKPRDRLITGRIQELCGWIDSEGPDFDLLAVCGRSEIRLRQCAHPVRRLIPGARGFWGYLVLQELLGSIRREFLHVDLLWNGSRLTTLHFRVFPVAKELARRYPLDLKNYPVGNGHPLFEPSNTARALIFPGLAQVGGSSLNQLMRWKMYQEGWCFPVYEDGNDAEAWTRFRALGMPSVRWVDGHDCYRAAADLSQPCARITLLREPIQRYVSLFNYASLVHPHEFGHATFEESVFSGKARQFSQSFRLLKCAGCDVSPSIPDDELYMRAEQELDASYALVGITELYEESIFLICELAGIESIGMWWRILSSPKSLRLGDLSRRIRNRLRRLLAVDLRLYEEKKKDLLNLLCKSDFGTALNAYRKAAREQPELPDVFKAVECLRWRQTIAEERLARFEREK